MTITPMDIHNKEFQNKLRGYDPNEVNEFMSLVQRELEQVLRDKKAIEDELKNAKERLANYDEMQEALNKSIVVAQDAADRLRENTDHEVTVVRKEAENYAHETKRDADDYAVAVKKDADLKVDAMLTEAIEKAKAIENETEELRKHHRIFRQRLQLLIESQLELIKNEEWDEVLKGNNIETPDMQMIEEIGRELGIDSVEEVPEDLVDDSEEEAPVEQKTVGGVDTSDGHSVAIEFPEENE